ncbi:hypothetical protein [Flaviaesturariibacter aridisoli]|uniref:Uncharacterized protein n=1 Tax=Flaviaesturariibacter aridisoli TaxID=2545761 RepID=A0A4R4DYJ2_9BACT|nr:hypothetical protein [Flaviaesturariibacter aridisoli]TCZ68356.1 hypothetical protein E0486_14285 [Flaviaesturariibacter aridisoli]
MKEQAIIHQEVVNRKGILRYLQVPLPGLAKRIIGVEASVMLLSALPALPLGGSPPAFPAYDPLFVVGVSDKAGSLSLQSPDTSDIFLQMEVFSTDVNSGLGDFSFVSEGPKEWLRGRKRYPVNLNVPTKAPILEGYYRDQWMPEGGPDITYQLNLIIWYEATPYDK